MSIMLHNLKPAPLAHGLSASKPQRCQPRICATVDPCLSKQHTSSAELSASLPLKNRRQALQSIALSGLGVLMGSGTMLHNPKALAKVSIAKFIPGAEGERDVEVTASGITMSLVSPGRGDPPAIGSTVLVDVVARLEDGTVFFSTRSEGASPLAVQLGTTNKVVTEGLSQVLETMRGGDVKLAVVPPALGYGARGVAFKSGSRVPPNAPLYYEVTLLRCQEFTLGLACCADADFPCIKKTPGGPEVTFTSAPVPSSARAAAST